MRGFWRKGGLVIAGAGIQGFGMGVFLFPHSIPSGGAGGLAVLINYWFNLNIGFSLWLVNFLMLALAIKYLGNRSTAWTIASITITSLSIYAFQHLIDVPQRNVLIDLALGSIFLGIGVGLLLREGVSNGGVGVIALIISNSRNTLPGKPLFLINGCIFILTASIIAWEIILQALLSQYISTVIVDLLGRANPGQSYSIGWRKK
ncbi:YitT family protein [Peribacillus deserti]|uniref:Membrane protein n=1 Tax=Peribacillus deserti TaxID=673318 RepID=A0A2N5LZU6_9BACI|nr:YitT family protein [Peribacillus deserti]PLT27634.1 membrane protein [Peribacillus deserti]